MKIKAIFRILMKLNLLNNLEQGILVILFQDSTINVMLL